MDIASRWGIIYCPKQGVRRTHKRWEHIKELLDAQHVVYDFVQSEGPESVERLTTMLINNGYKTIIIVGGDSALNRALNGMLSIDASLREQVVLGVIPNGRGNNFANYWGFTEEDDEQTVKWLIAKRLKMVDVGVIHQFGNSLEQPVPDHYFLNCVNVGLVANIMKLKYKARRLLGLTTLTYFASMLMLLFQRLESKMRFKINEEQIDRKVMTVCVGNCLGYGMTPRAVPYNGMLDVSVISHPEITQLFEGIWLLFTGRFLNHRKVRAYRTTRRILFEDIHHATVSTDGLVLDHIKTPFEVGLFKEHIAFIIPS